MSRTLIAATITLTLLAGCVTTPLSPPVAKTTPESISYSSVEQWLSLQADVSAMTNDEVVTKLVRVNKPEGAGQLFYYGLLNQQLNSRGSWAQARDTFRQLEDEETLTPGQRQLVGLLKEYNQGRINWTQKQRNLLQENDELQQALEKAEQENMLLQQKIQALTDLEAVISDRKEQ